MKEIIFSDNILQKENRIKIPNAIVETLNLSEGDPVTIILDVEEECIKIRCNKTANSKKNIKKKTSRK